MAWNMGLVAAKTVKSFQVCRVGWGKVGVMLFIALLQRASALSYTHVFSVPVSSSLNAKR
jgi:hypothetical protein